MARVVIKDRSKRYVKNLNKNLGDALEEATNAVTYMAKVECPKRTGNLARSIDSKTYKEELRSVVGSVLSYAWFVEMGTRKFAPRAYLRKGLYSSIEAIKLYINNAIAKTNATTKKK